MIRIQIYIFILISINVGKFFFLFLFFVSIFLTFFLFLFFRQDYFQTIAEDEKEKAFSDVSLIRGSLQGMFGGEELQRLRMIRKR